MNKIDRALYEASLRVQREPQPKLEPRRHSPSHVVVRVGPFRICRDLLCAETVVH